MTDTSQAIVTTFTNLITIYQEVGSLLQDSEMLLAKSGYSCLHGTTLGTVQSKNINNPARWITPYAARYFAKANPTELIGIGVFFVNPEFEPIEPLIVTACFRVTSGFNPQSDYKYWDLNTVWFYMPGVKVLQTELPFGAEMVQLGGKVRAVLLADVKDQITLQQLVIDPLVGMSCGDAPESAL